MASNVPNQPATSTNPLPSRSTFDPAWNQIQQSTDLPDDPDVQDAIKASLEEASKRLADFSPSQTQNIFAAQSQDIENDIVLSLSNHFAPLEDPDADTAVYMGYPPQGPEQKDSEYFHIKHHFDRVFLLHSANLKLMGEDSKFYKLLGPVSARTERRLRKQGLLDIPEAQRGSKFKYYIDLRPDTQDEEAIILLTDLTSTSGVLNWHLARSKYQLDPKLVLGYDDFDSIPKLKIQDDDASYHEKKTAHKAATTSSLRQGSLCEPPARSQPPQEYSQLRHWSAIERLLNAIEGRNPNLDSAPKVWTFFALAKYFGCAKHERISGWITSWIYREKNENFIQCNPEVAYRIGMGIQSAILVQAAFSILVGERALLVAYKEFNPPKASDDLRNVHQRKPESIDDDETNRIDHAASSLVQRMREVVHQLCISMAWLTDCPEYAKLHDVVARTEKEQNTINNAKAIIQEYVRGRIYYVVCQAQLAMDQLEMHLCDVSSFRSCVGCPFEIVYNTLNQSMRVFTKTLWMALSRTMFNAGSSNIASIGTPGQPGLTAYTQALIDEYPRDPLNGIKCIRRTELNNAIEAVNSMLLSHRQVDARISVHPVDLQNLIAVLDVFESSSLKHTTDIDIREAQDPTSPQKRRKTWDRADAEPIPPVSVSEESIGTSTSTSVRQALPLRQRLQPAHHQTGVSTRPQGLSSNESSRTTIDHWWNKNIGHAPAHQNSPQPSGQSSTFPTNTDTTVQQEHVNNNINSTSPGTGTGTGTGTGPVSGSFLNPTAASFEHSGPPKSQRTSKPAQPIAFPAVPTSTNTDKYMTTEILLLQVNRYIHNLCSKILHPTHLFHGTGATGMLPTNLFDNLLWLEDNEWRYLPLWAGGNDDGTGGVYDDLPLPIIDEATAQAESFRPGRIRRGFDAPSESDEAGGSDCFEEIESSQALSTVGRASKNATDGTAKTIADTVVSLGSESGNESASVSDFSDTAFVRLLLDDVSLSDGHHEPRHGYGHERAMSPNVSDDGLDTEHEFEYDDDDDDDDDDNENVSGNDSDDQETIAGGLDDDHDEGFEEVDDNYGVTTAVPQTIESVDVNIHIYDNGRDGDRDSHIAPNPMTGNVSNNPRSMEDDDFEMI
ncbi:hypothetical protein PV10_04884 [Exophiala mesophila]|uniref:Uncharacterized protein n=1 Tax=Exophiala mesophila TaxID=212818 RepID=A0A0D1ZIG2_EXOME|nr:uncharacterized protein PV10_04884 [Exophiala mesophila]KIV93689.1 hypothetical protein PV10_04884 [Exophiala mesophila]